MGKLSIAIATALALAGASVTAEEEETGKLEYLNSCASCHGEKAVGDGPLTFFLTLKVPDLTILAQENDGKFPMLDVIQMIDGRTGVRTHGDEMPIWGNRYRAEASEHTGVYGSETIVRSRILSLAYYLESIQK